MCEDLMYTFMCMRDTNLAGSFDRCRLRFRVLILQPVSSKTITVHNTSCWLVYWLMWLVWLMWLMWLMWLVWLVWFVVVI